MDWQRDTFESLYQRVGGQARGRAVGEAGADRAVRRLAGSGVAAGRGRAGAGDRLRAGDDAEELDARGFDVSAFDISQTAIDWCRRRFPETRVDYRAADLLDFPAEWSRGFALVVEIITIQSLPLELRERAVAAIGETVAPGGALYVWCLGRRDDEPVDNRPWPVSRADLRGFEAGGLTPDGLP